MSYFQRVKLTILGSRNNPPRKQKPVRQKNCSTGLFSVIIKDYSFLPKFLKALAASFTLFTVVLAASLVSFTFC